MPKPKGLIKDTSDCQKDSYKLYDISMQELEITSEEPIEHPFPISDPRDQVTPPMAHSIHMPTKTPKGSTLAHDQLWTLTFDGSKSKTDCGVEIELTSVKGKTFFVSYRLQFGCTNNVVEYEALAWGLMFAHKKKVTALMVKGDSKIVIKQVRNQYTYHNKKVSSIYKQGMEPD